MTLLHLTNVVLVRDSVVWWQGSSIRQAREQLAVAKILDPGAKLLCRVDMNRLVSVRIACMRPGEEDEFVHITLLER